MSQKPRNTQPCSEDEESSVCLYCPATVFIACRNRTRQDQSTLCENPYGLVGVKAALLFYAQEHDGTFTVRDITSTYGDIQPKAVWRSAAALNHQGLLRATPIEGTIIKRYEVVIEPQPS